MPAAANTITLKGKVVYNDQRDNGHFDWRRDLSGNPGAEATDSTNYLGAYYVVADFYELDSVAGSPLHLNCKKEKYLGSATLNADGEYSFSFNATDNCGADDNSYPDIGVRFRLRFCGSDSVCFSIQDDRKNTYQLWHPDAWPEGPLEVDSGTYELRTMLYQVTANDDYAKAASNYAYAVDMMQVWHYKNEIPFDPRGDGELYIQFPSTEADDHGNAFTKNDHRIFLKSTWNYQSTVWHEYGHILHMRAWNGSTGECGDCPDGAYDRGGDDGWSAVEREYPHTALKEGWAEFVKASTKYWPAQSCGTGFDDNESSSKSNWICNADPNQYPDDTNTPVTYPNDGKSYIRNVKKLFCDWYDDHSYDDDDSNMAGYGDTFTASLYSTWSNMQAMWDWVSDRSGLTVCNYIDYYLNGRKGVSAVGESQHDAYKKAISNLSYNNGIKCGLEIETESEPAAPTRASCMLDDTVITRPVSGAASSFQSTISMPNANFHAIRGISNREHADRPCSTTVTYGRFPNASGATPEVTRTSSNCSGSTGDEISVGVVRESLEGVFVGALRICRNNNGRRLKGLQVKFRTVKSDCTTEHFEADDEATYPEDYAGVGTIENGLHSIITEESDSRNNCADWGEWRYCPAGSVATGLVLHDGGSGVNGIQLQCRNVIAR